MRENFRQLSLEDRQKIEESVNKGIHKKEIAESMEISLSGLYRELGRIPKGHRYTAAEAQLDCEKKRSNKQTQNVLHRYPNLGKYIARQILRYHVSPATIVKNINGGKTPFPPNCISLSTVYNQIRMGAIPGVSNKDVEEVESTEISG